MSDDISILIVGLVRDCEKNIESEYNNLKNLFKSFCTIKFLLVESDSKDFTVKILKNLSIRDKDFNYISKNDLINNYPERTDRLAYCRNLYLKKIKNNISYEHIKYVMVYDWDGINKINEPTKIKNLLINSSKWDAIFPNQGFFYYDLWALRNDKVKIDIWRFYNKLRKNISYFYAHYLINKRFYHKIKINKNWLKVKSAFGGYGIYKKEVLLQAEYIGRNKINKPICEHVPLNLFLSNKGYKLFIVPNLINGNINSHSIKYFKAFLLIHYILDILGHNFRQILKKNGLITYI